MISVNEHNNLLKENKLYYENNSQTELMEIR
jgi:hypothetical protein